mgnify:CR=1 FL=1
MAAASRELALLEERLGAVDPGGAPGATGVPELTWVTCGPDAGGNG